MYYKFKKCGPFFDWFIVSAWCENQLEIEQVKQHLVDIYRGEWIYREMTKKERDGLSSPFLGLRVVSGKIVE